MLGATRSTHGRPVGVLWLAGLPVGQLPAWCACWVLAGLPVGRVPIWWPVAVLCLVLACPPVAGGPSVAVLGAVVCPPVAGGLPVAVPGAGCHQIEHPARGGVGCLVLVPVAWRGSREFFRHPCTAGAADRGRAVAGAKVIHPPPTPFNCQKLS